jgi:hypothetical protein
MSYLHIGQMSFEGLVQVDTAVQTGVLHEQMTP